MDAKDEIPVAQNGEARGSDSDSDEEMADHGGPGSQEYEISEESKIVRERQEKAMQELLMKRRAAALAVPTNDMAVRARLQRLGEPITLFGEREMERRDRLRMLMARLDAQGQLEKLMKAHENEEAAASAAPAEEEDIQYPFYTEGSKALFDARVEIAMYSLVTSALGLHRARRKRDDQDEDADAEVDWALKQARTLTLDSSEIGDERPLSGCSFSHDWKDASDLFTEWNCKGSYDTTAKVWSSRDFKPVKTLCGHEAKVTSLDVAGDGQFVATVSHDWSKYLEKEEKMDTD